MIKMYKTQYEIDEEDFEGFLQNLYKDLDEQYTANYKIELLIKKIKLNISILDDKLKLLPETSRARLFRYNDYMRELIDKYNN